MSGVGDSAEHGSPRLLVVDDEETQREMLSAILARASYRVETAPDGEKALEILEQRSFDLVLTDQKMPKMDGLELLAAIRSRYPRLPVVLMTAFGSVSSAVEAMKNGAADYLTKPFEKEELVIVLSKSLRQYRLEDEVATLRGALRERFQLGNIIGNSSVMQEVFTLIERIAGTDVPILIQGESGTGKELVARAIHEGSTRAGGPFVALNCSAIPETLIESELFGHERGAFTGAVRSHAGMFEQASDGTLFLDEIGAMRIDLQPKLLRALQENVVQRLGADRPTDVNVRIVAATCEDLEESIRGKRFREDLYYRLSVVPIRLPALRERSEDIPLLTDHFLSKAISRFGREAVSVAPEVLDRMQAHSWPGNVRELENCIDRMVLLSRGQRLVADDLPPAVQRGPDPGDMPEDSFALPPQGVALEELESHLIRQALQRTRGSLGPAARLLGISYKTLQYRIRKYELDLEEARGK